MILTCKNFAAKFVLNKRKQDSATECLKELHWLSVKFRCIYKLLTIVCNSLKKEGLTYLQTKLNMKHSQISTRNSAQDNKTINLVTSFNRRKIYADHGFTFTAAQQWNKLPSHMKNSKNIKEFKKKHFTTHLYTQAFCN